MFHCLVIVLKISLFSMSSSHNPVIRINMLKIKLCEANKWYIGQLSVVILQFQSSSAEKLFLREVSEVCRECNGLARSNSELVSI